MDIRPHIQYIFFSEWKKQKNILHIGAINISTTEGKERLRKERKLDVEGGCAKGDLRVEECTLQEMEKTLIPALADKAQEVRQK